MTDEATVLVGEGGDEYNRRHLTLLGIIGAALVALMFGTIFTMAAFEVLLLQLTQWACLVAALFALVMCLYSVPLWQFERKGIGIRLRR